MSFGRFNFLSKSWLRQFFHTIKRPQKNQLEKWWCWPKNCIFFGTGPRSKWIFHHLRFTKIHILEWALMVGLGNLRVPTHWSRRTRTYIVQDRQCFWSNYSDLTRVFTPNGGLVRDIPLFQGNLGWWNIRIWPDVSTSMISFEQIGEGFWTLDMF